MCLTKFRGSYVLLTLLISFFSQPVFSQTMLKGKVLIDSTNTPVSYATVSIKNRNVGTVTDSSGRFELKVPPQVKSTDTLVITSIGYSKNTLSMDKARAIKEFRLNKMNTELQPVIMRSRFRKTIGVDSQSVLYVKSWPEIKTGGEIGNVYKIDNKPCKLEKVIFKMDNKYDSCQLRLHIRKCRGGFPAEELLTKDIIKSFPSHSILNKDAEFDISEHNIVLDETEVFIGFEVIDCKGYALEKKSFSFLGVESGTQFYKLFSTSDWIPYDGYQLYIKMVVSF